MDVLAVALRAEVSEDTVRRFLRGLAVHDGNRSRIEKALAALHRQPRPRQARRKTDPQATAR
jgi:DNA-binding LacI/PurR family transcriptional regulator